MRVLIEKSGAPHQSKAPSSEFKFRKSSGAPHQSKAPTSEFKVRKSSASEKPGRPISPRLHPRSSRVPRVLMLRYVRQRCFSALSEQAALTQFGVTT